MSNVMKAHFAPFLIVRYIFYNIFYRCRRPRVPILAKRAGLLIVKKASESENYASGNEQPHTYHEFTIIFSFRYISADFVNHPTSDLALSLLKKHNVELFEVCPIVMFEKCCNCSLVVCQLEHFFNFLQFSILF
jgi:hypothetical protein